MAVIATGSKFSRNNAYILMIACVVFAAWFAYDGWVDQEYRQEQTKDGKPTPNLLFNRYVPIPLIGIAIYGLISAQRIPLRKVVADENGLVIRNQPAIPYGSITAIDKRFFEKDGYFLVKYRQGDTEKSVKLSDRKYDNMGLLLDELIKKTGAEPADSGPA